MNLFFRGPALTGRGIILLDINDEPRTKGCVEKEDIMFVIPTKQLARRIDDKINSTKRVSRKHVEVQEIEHLLEVVDALNQLTEYERSFDGLYLDKVFLPVWVKPLLYPEKVAFGSQWIYPDIVFRSKSEETIHYCETKIRDIGNKVAEAYKKEAVFDSVLGLRPGFQTIDKTHLSVRGQSRESDIEAFVPVPVKDDILPILGDHYFNISSEEVMQHWIDRVFMPFMD